MMYSLIVLFISDILYSGIVMLKMAQRVCHVFPSTLLKQRSLLIELVFVSSVSSAMLILFIYSNKEHLVGDQHICNCFPSIALKFCPQLRFIWIFGIISHTFLFNTLLNNIYLLVFQCKHIFVQGREIHL